jgi:hypothetical protein
MGVFSRERTQRARGGRAQPKGITTDFTDGTDKNFSICEIREIRG